MDMKKATNLKIYNRERDEMTDISGIFSIGSSTNPQWISLCGHLEAIIGNYFLSQAGNPEAYWYAEVPQKQHLIYLQITAFKR